MSTLDRDRRAGRYCDAVPTTHTRGMRRWLVVMILLASTMGVQAAWACPEPHTSERDLVLRQMARMQAAEYQELKVRVGVLGALGLAGVGLLLARHFRRVNALHDAQPEPLSLLVAERLARTAQRRGGVVAAVGIAGVPALVIMNVWLPAIIATIVAAVGVRRFGIARSVLEMVDAPDRVAAEAIGHIVVVRSPIQEVQLEVAPGALARERRRAVPMARAMR